MARKSENSEEYLYLLIKDQVPSRWVFIKKWRQLLIQLRNLISNVICIILGKHTIWKVKDLESMWETIQRLRLLSTSKERARRLWSPSCWPANRRVCMTVSVMSLCGYMQRKAWCHCSLQKGTAYEIWDVVIPELQNEHVRIMISATQGSRFLYQWLCQQNNRGR